MNAVKFTLQRCTSSQLRHFHKCFVVRTAEAAPAPAVEKMQIPIPEGAEKPVSPKIDKLVTEISSLNLIEVSELSSLLKKRLNLPDAPVMPMGGFMAPAAKEEDEEPKAIKTSFTVKLVKYDDSKKVTLIKEMKTLLPELNLVQAKKFVESVPNVVKADVTKEESEAIKAALEKVGATVEIE